MSKWYVAVDGNSIGPMSTSQLSAALSSRQYPESSMVWRDGFADWQPATTISELSNPTPAAAPPPPPVSASQAHEIDYEIFGHEMQFVEIELDPRESVVSEAGAMMYMSDNIEIRAREKLLLPHPIPAR